MTGDAGTFTEADLRAAVRRSGETESYVQALLADMREHREAEYEPGDCVLDANGWTFLRSRIGDWVAFDGSRLPHVEPRRPLRKLVPEGRKAGHGQILAELTQWTNLPRAAAVDLAWRICKLTGGECDGD